MPEEVIQFFRFVSHPRATNPRVAELEGAYICAWVDHPDAEIAEQIARSAISKENWEIDEIEAAEPLARDEFVSDPARKGVLPRFTAHGLALTYFCWPLSEAGSHER